MNQTHDPRSDFLAYEARLTGQEKDYLQQLKELLRREVDPHVTTWWAEETFPHHIVEPLARTGLFALADPERRPFESSALFRGLVTLTLARSDASIATFNGVHSGLATGSIAMCGSVAQQERWLPAMATGELIGSFALTEPESGSDVSRGMRTTARRDGDEWVIDGAKRWIGNATWCDLIVVWAKDAETGEALGFVVPRTAPGVTAERIEGKQALRIVQNAHITLDGVRVPESDRLHGANSFRDTNKVLRTTRLDVAWASIGNALGALDAALAYTAEREQFGRTIDSFQLVQDHLVQALASISSATALAARSAELADAGALADEQSALTKLVTTTNARSAVAHCRELLGGNGILLDHDVIRRFADAEALYSFEGTREVNTLIVGRSLTGKQAFTR